MSKSQLSRREFLKATAAAGAAAAMVPKLALSAPMTAYDAKGVPTREFGSTGVMVPIMSIGLGSRFMSVEDDDTAAEIMTRALDNGLYYWDTAASYGNDRISSEERVGKILKDRRKEVFVSTKVEERDADGAKRTIEQSLKRLQTDYIDVYNVHSIASVEDVQSLADGVMPVLLDYKEQGIIRFIGFTGHTDARAMKLAAQMYDCDLMVIALNHYQQGEQAFEESAVPAAAEKGMGVSLIKAVRPRELVEGLDPNKLVRYALSMDQVTAAIVGTDSVEVLDRNLETLRNFKPYDEEEMEEIRLSLNPFYESDKIPWMAPSYRDGWYA